MTDQEKLQIQQQLLETSRGILENEEAAAKAAKDYGLAAQRAVSIQEEELKIAKVRYDLLIESSQSAEQRAAAVQAYAAVLWLRMLQHALHSCIRCYKTILRRNRIVASHRCGAFCCSSTRCRGLYSCAGYLGRCARA